MKNSKIVALVATAALLVIGAAFTSMAATYNWYQVDGIWHCKDKNGDDYAQAWAKSGSDMYYLDENGEMATETLVDYDDALYYVDADGKMVKNDWRKIENAEDDGDEYYWYYFQNSGKAKKDTATPVSINGKKYLFDEDSHMQYGWIGSTSNKEDDYAWQDAVYYAGEADDGAVKTGWIKLDVIDDDDTLDFEEQSYWFWFQTSGKKYAAPTNAILVEKSINGKKYAFDEKGVMRAEWEQSVHTATDAKTVASISNYAWFQDAEIGAKLKKGWFRVAPAKGVNATDNEEETAHWFYAKGNGELYTEADGIKTINGKKYAFNKKGEMLSGLYKLVGTEWEAVDTEKAVDDLTAVGADEAVLYFFGDEETDGSMKLGTVKTEIDGADYTLYFKTTGSDKGTAYNGLKGSNFYVNGAKVAADSDMRYEMFECDFDDATGKVSGITKKCDSQKTYPGDGKACLISSSGAIVKSGTKKNADDIKIKVYAYKVIEVKAN